MRLFEGTPFDRPPRCEHCDQLEEECVCPAPQEVRVPPEKQRAKLGREIRKGKRTVTTIRGLADEGNHLTELLKTLKSQCGAGGTVVEGVIEIQGDQQERLRAALKSLGYRVS